MSTNLRLPNITGKTDTEKITQLTRYIYQLTEQLNFSLNEIESPAGGAYGASLRSDPGGDDAALTEAEKLEKSYSTIKSMIIKSADFTESLYEEVKLQLGGSFVAKSEFGTYREKTDMALDANSAGITQLYSYTSNIRSDYGDFDVANQSYIKTGLLYEEDSQPVYGVGVGLLTATTDADGHRVIDRGNLAATFTPGKISFWGNDTELAYITPTQIYFPSGTLTAYGAKITGDITGGTINIGNRFLVDAAGNATLSGSIRLTGDIIWGEENDPAKIEESLSARITANTEGLSALSAWKSGVEDDVSSIAFISAKAEENAAAITAKVSTTGGNASSFSWSLTENGFLLKSNGAAVMDVTAAGAEVTGKITATTGKIAGFEITGDLLKGQKVGMCGAPVAGSDETDCAFWAGSDTGLNAPFRVGHAGEMKATYGEIGGWQISPERLRKTFTADATEYEVSFDSSLNKTVGTTTAAWIEHSTSLLVKENETPVFYIRPNGKAFIGGFDFSPGGGIYRVENGTGVAIRRYGLEGYRDGVRILVDWYDVCEAVQKIVNGANFSNTFSMSGTNKTLTFTNGILTAVE